MTNIINTLLGILICFLLTSRGVNGEFDPYVDHGGTVVGLAGRNFCILAADSRLSQAHMIHSRNHSRLLAIGNGCGLCGSGCWPDIEALASALKSNVRAYEWQGGQQISLEATSNLLSTLMYGRRMFPYFTFSVLGGLDKCGAGALYRYDAVGSFERVRAVCAGKGEQLIQPSLDRLTNMEEDQESWQMGLNEFESDVFESQGVEATFVDDLSVQEAIDIIVKSFQSASEREISIGDGLDVMVIESGGGNNLSDARDSKSTTEHSGEPHAHVRWFRHSLPKH